MTINHLSKSYDGKKFALKDCSFSLEAGKICAVVGESGSGKSTLLRLIAGLERPENGSVTLNEQVVSDDRRLVAPQKRNIGFVFQDFALFPHLTVEKNIAFGLPKKASAKVKEMLQLIQMEGYAKAYPGELSGGQAQRVALARTLATHPGLLLLDEPFSNLDAGLKSGLRQEIRQIVKRLETTMIFITHDLYDALDIADEIIFLEEGTMLQHSSIQEFAQNSKHPTIKALLADLSVNAQNMLKMTS